MDLQIVVLVKCDLVCVQDVKPTFYGTQVAGKEVSFRYVVVSIPSEDCGACENGEISQLSDHKIR